MSIHGLMTGRKAAALAVYRATTARDADGSTTTSAFTPAGTARGFLDGITAELAARVFGTDVRVELRALVPLAADVRLDDRLLVASGTLLGQRFRVAARHIVDTRARTGHVELALVSTTEGFGG